MNANNDNEMSQELSGYLDGELNDTDTARVEKVLSQSPELTRELRQLRNTREMLRNLPRTTAPDGFAARAIAAAEKHVTRRGRKISVWFWRVGIAAAVIIAAVTVSYPLLVKRQTPGGEKFVQEYAPSEKIGDIARDLKADDKLKFDDVKKEISARKPSATVGRKKVAKPDSSTLGFGVKESEKINDKLIADDHVDESRKLGRKSKMEVGPSMRESDLNGRRTVITRRLDGKSVAKLATANRRSNNEFVWSDNIEAEKKNIKKLLASSGLQIVPETQEVLESNQVMNLSSNQIYISNISGKDRAIAMNGKEVEYLVYGSPEQISAIRKELRGKVQMRQRVSQLPEDAYRHAIAANADPVAEDKDAEQLRGGSPKGKGVSGDGGISIGIATRPTSDSPQEGAPPEEAEATRKAKVATTKLKEQAGESGHIRGFQQTAAMMITLRYRPQAQLNPRQADAITKLERLNQMPLSQKQNIAAKSLEMKKAPTSKPAAKPAAAPACDPAAGPSAK